MKTFKPYEYCATRLEQRGWQPPSRDFSDNLAAALEASGVEAVVHSAVAQSGRALFPSKVFPNNHPDANFESFRYLIEKLHAIGRPVLSWYPLNHSSAVAEAHPDWRIIPMQGGNLPPQQNPAESTFLCVNSPYGVMLPEFCREIVGDVGFDGVWFDGSTFAVDGNSLPGCRCEFCRRRFKDETGEDLPDAVDWDSRAFKVWVNWRYDKLMALWKACLDAMLAVKPQATVCFNNYRRRRSNTAGGWHTGIPLRKLGWDCVMSGELDLQVFHGDFQMKMHRAYGCARGQDSWMALCDHWNCWVPDVETLPIQQAAVACAAAGGVMWMGTGTPAHLSLPVLAAAQEASAPLMPYAGGEPVQYAAIWCSQQTQDFFDRDWCMCAWDEWHGANELCLHAHLPSAIVFDDHVADGDIVGKYPVLLAGNTACVSARQAEMIRRYVEQGGVLLACADFAMRDEMGVLYDSPPLDELLGIMRRRPGAHLSPTLELKTQRLIEAAGSRWVSWKAVKHALADPRKDVELLADTVDHPGGSWDNHEGRGEPYLRFPGLWLKRHGKGSVIYAGPNLFLSHIAAPTGAQVRFFKALLEPLAPPPITLDAPMCVTLNVRERGDGVWMAHLHNAPGSLWRYATPCNSGELVPVRGIALHAGRAVLSAVSGLNGQVFPMSSDRQTVSIPELHRNEVVLLRFA